MDRRRFLLTALTGVLIAPLDVEGQQAGMLPRVGVLTLSVAASMPSFQAFLQGLRDQGYVAGRNITLEFRFADGKPERLTGMANELVRLKVDVIVTESVLAAREARKATGTIPIVTAIHGDPVGAGLGASPHRPRRQRAGPLAARARAERQATPAAEGSPSAGYARGHHLERH